MSWVTCSAAETGMYSPEIRGGAGAGTRARARELSRAGATLGLVSAPYCYCAAPDCRRPTRGGRELCEAHAKRVQRGQLLSPPIAEPLSPRGRVLEAALAWVEADSEDDRVYGA